VSDLIVVLGDQLRVDGTALAAANQNRDTVIMMEVPDEGTYVPQHKQKIALILSAMRHFAEELRAQGWRVDYVRLDDHANSGSLVGELTRALQRHRPDRLVMTHPGEFRVRTALKAAFPDLVEIEDTRFIGTLSDFAAWAQGRKSLRLEYFYRMMRERTGLLMTKDGPEGGRWNYDADNRTAADPDQTFPAPLRFSPDAITQEVLGLVEHRFGDHIGKTASFGWPVTADQAQQALDDFISHRLPNFGATQDAMLTG